MQTQRVLTAFIEKCYRLYEQKMYQAAYRILNDSGKAEDAVQEAFLKLMKSNVYFENPESEECRRYMLTVIKHASIDIYNKNKREAEFMYLTGGETWLNDTSGGWDSGFEFDWEEFTEGLPDKYQAVVRFLVIHGLSVRETAHRLGISEAAVRKRFERAKKMLKATQKGCEDYETGK